MERLDVAVIGRTGQLAACLRKHARQGWMFFGRDALDLTRGDAIAAVLDRYGPRMVINAAAYTAVDRAESEPDVAFAVNAHAPAALARWCAENASCLVHISTDYVFDGSGERAWQESDATAPLNVYGLSKRAGEEAILASGAVAAILRTSWVHSPYGANFVKTMLRLACERDQLGIVDDQRGAPTSAQDLADAIVALLPLLEKREVAGLYHCAAAGATSWAGFAQAIFAGALSRGLIARAPVVTKVGTAQYPTPARRPLNSVLCCARLPGQSGIALPGWRIGLQRTLDALCSET